MSSEIKTEIQLEIGHVLFMDIVDYSTRLIDEQRALRDVLNQIVRSTKQFRNADAAGNLIKSPTGDGMALVFHRSPEEPVECALEISRALKGHPNLPLRMGVHSGPVRAVVDVNDQTGVAGAGVHVAQRVMDCGDAGHILLSKHIAEDLGDCAHWQLLLHDLGECEVKHGVRLHLLNLYTEELGNPEPPEKFKHLRGKKKISRAVAGPTARAVRPNRALTIAGVLIAIVLAVAMTWFWPRPPPKPVSISAPAIPYKSIAVLPFENRSHDPENAYFAYGIQDEILTRLSKIADLKVISRTSTERYKSVPENLPEIARQLGVAHILEGSVQKSGDAVRVNVQLIRAATDSHLWADSFDRKLTDIFSVESEIATTIAEQLQAKLTGQEEQIIAAKPTDNSDAYNSYLRGLAYALKTLPTPANTLSAREYLTEAVRLDPKFALAWALLSYVDARGYISLRLKQAPALCEEARQAAETALALQPNLGEAVLTQGYYHYACLKDYDTAMRYLEQARQFLPNSSRIPELLAYVTRRHGHWEQSDSFFSQAERLDPRNVQLLAQHALSYICLRRFPEALGKLDQVLNITPDDGDTVALKAGIAQAEGDLPRAAAILAPLHSNADDPVVLETQVYQAILERRAAPIIPRLKEILEKPEPALGYLNGELRFFLGWVQNIAGDPTAAQKTWLQARSELESFLKEQPKNINLLGDLALTNMELGDKAAAFALTERMMAALPVEKDAMGDPIPIEMLARVAANMGEHDRAITALQKVLSLPYLNGLVGTPLTAALLRLDPMFDPLRNDPRFQKFAAEK